MTGDAAADAVRRAADVAEHVVAWLNELEDSATSSACAIRRPRKHNVANHPAGLVRSSAPSAKWFAEDELLAPLTADERRSSASWWPRCSPGERAARQSRAG